MGWNPSAKSPQVSENLAVYLKTKYLTKGVNITGTIAVSH